MAETTLSTAAPAMVPTTPRREPRAAAVAAAIDPPSSWVRERSSSLNPERVWGWVPAGAATVDPVDVVDPIEPVELVELGGASVRSGSSVSCCVMFLRGLLRSSSPMHDERDAEIVDARDSM